MLKDFYVLNNDHFEKHFAESEYLVCEKKVVGFVDILGFKNIIGETSLSKLVNKFNQFLKIEDYINSYKHVNTKLCIRYIFSDSIVFYSQDNTLASFLKLLYYSWNLYRIALGSGFLLRGAIVYDEFYAKENLLLGKALTKAAISEKKQDWSGIVIDKSIYKIYPYFDNFINYLNLDKFYPYYNIPFKDNDFKKMRCINWSINTIFEYSLKELLTKNINKDCESKINNTLKFAKKMINMYTNENVKINFGNETLRYNKMYISKKNPSKNSIKNIDNY